MGNALGIGLTAAGAMVGAVVVLSIVLVLMGVGASEENYEPPTITLPVGMVLLAGMSLFAASVVSFVSIMT